MMLFNKYWLAMVMLATAVALPIRTMASTPTVVISEVAWAGSSLSSSDEWIELTNVSSDPVDLSSWYLSGGGSGGSDLVIPEGTSVEPHSTYLIANYAQTHENAALLIDPHQVTATLSLSNEGFALHLYNSGGTEIDSAGDGGAPFAGGSGSTADTSDGRYRSMVRVDVSVSGSNASVWTDATSSAGFKDAIEDLGTPGFVDVAFIESVEEPVEEEEGEVLAEEVTPSEDEVVTEPTESSTSATSVILNEFVSDPKEDGVEWIELFNDSDTATSLVGWSVTDETGKATLIEAGDIEAGAFFVIEKPAGKLNNDGDVISLLNPESNVVDTVTYGSEELSAPPKGSAAARDDSGTWVHTTEPTSGTTNIISDVVAAEEDVVETVEEVIVEEDADDEDVEETLADQEDESVSEETETNDEQTSIEDVGEEEAQTYDSYPVGSVVISEFVSNPLEDDVEWIELQNVSGAVVETHGWKITDATDRATALQEAVLLDGESLIITKPKGQLNNDGDTISLFDGTSALIDSLTYGTGEVPAPAKGESLALIEGVMTISPEPTPGTYNIAPQDQEESTETQEESVEEETAEEVVVEIEETTQVPMTLNFSKLYPNTAGSDAEEEYMVITNTGDEPVSLSGWVIEDGSTDRYTGTDLSIEAGDSLTLMRPVTKLALNNAGDTLQLFAPDGTLVDQVTYGQAAQGATYNFVDGTWIWSGQKTQTQTSSTSSAPSSSSSVVHVSYTSTNAMATMSIAEARALKDDQQAKISGMVTVVPGAFASQYIYIQDETGGIQVYKHDGQFPELNVGDRISFTGTLSTSYGERRIRIASGSELDVAQAVATFIPELSLAEINESFVGQLVSTEGIVQSRASNKVILEDDGKELVIYLNTSPAVSSEQFTYGSHVTITGILTSSNGELRIRPRSQDDITMNVEEETEEIVTSAAYISGSGDTDSQSQMGYLLLLTTMAALGLLALRHYYPQRKRQIAA